MAFFDHLAHHPRRLWIRKAIFQVHLWGGVLVALYLVVIALSGSVLVFEAELTRWSLPATLVHRSAVAHVPLAEVVANAGRLSPGLVVDNVILPSTALPAFQLAAHLPDGRQQNLLADAVTGAVLPLGRTWVAWVHDLHVYLLLNKRYGLQVNAVGAAVLLLLVVSGLALWWPGVRIWTRGLRVNLRANWRRVNYDLHSAIGFWTLLLVCWWALSGVYFGFYRQVAAAVNVISPVKNMVAPTGSTPAHSVQRVPLATLLQAAQTASPHGHLYSLSNVFMQDTVSYALMDLGAPGDFTHRDIVRLDATSGKVLSVWHYSEKHSLGDWVLWLMHPLHFGTLWGLTVKVVWCAAGVLLAVLSVTGVLMYWNRYLRHHVSV